MRQLYYIFTLLFFVNTAFTQSLDIHTSYLTSLDYSPRWRAGMEYNTKFDRLAFSLDVGYGNYTINKFRINGLKWRADYELLEVRQEIKYFFNKNFDYSRRLIKPFFPYSWITSTKNASMYAGIELFYVRLDNTFKDDYYEEPYSGLNIEYDKALYHKRKIGGHAKYGVRYVTGKLVVDNSLGIGIARRNRFFTDHINAQEVTDVIEPAERFNNGHRKAGEALIYHLTFNLKVGYIFWQKED